MSKMCEGLKAGKPGSLNSGAGEAEA